MTLCRYPAVHTRSGFNPHTHEGCDQWFQTVFLPIFCFNPHTHEGCDLQGFYFLYVSQVSIHTPTKGVTRRTLSSSTSMFMFQSTHPRRVWRFGVKIDRTHLSVSIHTPTKGVTAVIEMYCYIKKFQSTHPRRVWPDVAASVVRYDRFQSTHPRRVWLPCSSPIGCKPLGFNPHTHEGCDAAYRPALIALRVSIHTPTKGVTRNKLQNLVFL